MSIPSWTFARICEPFRTEARGATIFGRACERLGFARRVTILFEVADDTVNVIGVYYGGQDYEADLRDDGDEA